LTLTERLLQAIERDERAVVLTILDGDDVGTKLLVVEGEPPLGDAPPGLAAEAPEALRRARNRVFEWEGRKVFAEVYAPPARLLVYGAVDTADALCAAAAQIGWRTIVADARSKFATPERMRNADEVVVAWPEETLAQVRPDSHTAVVCLSHDDKFDLPMLKGALASDAFYVGAIGSRRTQDKRRARLLESGVAEDDLARIHGPAGLDIGAESPAETALAILAEILAVRAGREGGPLRARAGRISVHAES
jgi:xanthine dehydrogenase accessory factor